MVCYGWAAYGPRLFRALRHSSVTDSGLFLFALVEEGTERLVRSAVNYAIKHKKPSVTLVHKGNIMKFTSGAFRDWGYAMVKREFNSKDLDGGFW